MTSKEFDFLDGMDSKEALRTLRVSANTYCRHNDTQCKINKELYEIILKDLEKLEKYEKYIPQLIEGHEKLQMARDWGDIADSAFLIRTALEKIGVIEED